MRHLSGGRVGSVTMDLVSNFPAKVIRPPLLIIDEDLGQSGRTADVRLGFRRLPAEVSMDHVGLVLGLEMSRLSRSCRDWHHLLEVCGLFGALLADQDGLSDPSDPDDRLVLGLKRQLSEMELYIIRSRLERGKLNKARRVELLTNAPIGHVKTPAGDLAPDPDEQVRRVVLLVFDNFDELGTVHVATRYLRGPTAPSWAFGGGATTRARLRRRREGLPSEGRDPSVGSRRSSGEVHRSALVRRAPRPGIM